MIGPVGVPVLVLVAVPRITKRTSGTLAPKIDYRGAVQVFYGQPTGSRSTREVRRRTTTTTRWTLRNLRHRRS